MHIADRILLHKKLFTTSSALLAFIACLLLPLGLVTSAASAVAKPLGPVGAGTTATAVAALATAGWLISALETARRRTTR